MHFSLIDRIVEIKPKESITAVKALSLAEEYLCDHFPLFPVMPGVLMLEAATQAGAWLVRRSEDFAHSMVILKEARNVKYAAFVKPGQLLEVQAAVAKEDETTTTLTVRGTIEGALAVTARITLERFNLADRVPGREATDACVRNAMRSRFALLYPSAEASATVS